MMREKEEGREAAEYTRKGEREEYHASGGCQLTLKVLTSALSALS